MSSNNSSNLPCLSVPIVELFGTLSDDWKKLSSLITPRVPDQDIEADVRQLLPALEERGRQFAGFSSVYSQLAKNPELSEVPGLRDDPNAQALYIARTISHLQHSPYECVSWALKQAPPIHTDDMEDDLLQLAAGVWDHSEEVVSKLRETLSK